MDNSFIIDNLLDQDESSRLEFKSNTSSDTIGKIITSFINTQGGDLLLGVGDDKSVLGIKNAKHWVDKVNKIINQDIKPLAPVSVQLINHKKKELILVSIWEGSKKPYQYKGNIYVRENDVTKLSNAATLTNLIAQRKSADFEWERRTVLGASLADLDIDEITTTINAYKNYKADANIEDAEDFLFQTGLIQGGSFTNACIVLFAKNPTQFIPQSRIRLTVYPEDKSANVFLNDIILEGNQFKNISSIFTFLDNNFGKKMTVNGTVRTEKFNYPRIALREGILNAMVHRDYNSINGFMQINIFNNRTEIINFGGLPNGITIKDLKVEHNSILRNPDIAHICFIRKYIEMLGSGTLRMINDCKLNKFKIPKWTDEKNITSVVFPELTFSSVINEGVSEGVSEGVNNRDFSSQSEGVISELNTVLAHISKYPGQRAPIIADNLNRGKSTIERYLKQLKERGYIEFKGSSKTGGYYMINK